jgi:hypothetical protein
LDLTDEKHYRDFSKPMGIQDPARVIDVAGRCKSIRYLKTNVIR